MRRSCFFLRKKWDQFPRIVGFRVSQQELFTVDSSEYRLTVSVATGFVILSKSLNSSLRLHLLVRKLWKLVAPDRIYAVSLQQMMFFAVTIGTAKENILGSLFSS